MNVGITARRTGGALVQNGWRLPYFILVEALLLSSLGLASSGQSATMTLGTTNVGNGASFAVPLVVNSGTSALGDYSVTITFNTNLLQLTGILGGNGEFSTPPATINSNTPGQVFYDHQQTVSLTSPTGAVLVSQVAFTAIGAGGNVAPLTIITASAHNTDTAILPITATNNGSVTLVAAPVANFTGTPTNGLAPLPVTFTDSSTGSISNRFWAFGDGSTTNTLSTSVVHSYTLAGSNSVSLTVSGIGGSNTFTRLNYIIVTNKPPQLSVSPSSQAFGSVTIGQSNTLPFQVVNLGELTLTGTAAVSGPFSVSSGSPYNIPGGQTGVVNVSFIPLSAGFFSNGVVFASNGGGSTNPVTGTGLTPASITVTPATLSFGTITTGTTSQLSFVITNAGQSVLNGTAAVTGGPYAIQSGTPFTLPGLGSTNLVVSFSPLAAGTFSNSVAFASNGGNPTNALVGTGAIIPVASFTASPTNGIAPLTVTFNDSSTGTITNHFWDFGDGVTTNTSGTTMLHTYGVAGTNTVTLIASGPVGASTNSKPALIAVVVYPPGDVNGTFTVTTGDSLLINQVAASLRATNDAVFAGAGYANGDANQDGVVDTGDSLLINQVVVHLRAYVVTKVLPNRRTNTVPTQVTIYGIGFPTNTVTGVTIGPPVNLTLTNIVVISQEQIRALVPAGGGSGTGTVNVVASPTNGVISFGSFINQ